jgi:molybdopterin/thiamine biosynthesis adenylyltransferase
MKTRKIKVIGLGGIGCWLVEPLARYLSHTGDSIEVTLVDGDSYEEKNRNRQSFDKLENKAVAKAEEMTKKLPKVFFKGKGDYVTENNVISLIRENDTVFLCVDNHSTRKLVSDRCSELDNVVLISGGNDFTDGNVIYYVRQNGEDITKSPTALHAKIANPTDRNPGDEDVNSEGCEALAETNPQLLFTNLAIASSMCNVYYAHEQGKAKFEQVYLDILTQRMRPAPQQV